MICLGARWRCGGAVVVSASSRRLLVSRHGADPPDGARLFNAAVATGLPVTAWTQHVGSIQLCLSKGLGAPVGSMVVGDADFVNRARQVRKMLGGGMRQAGVIAAAGIVALKEMVDRLAEDHANARILAAGVATVPGAVLDPPEVQTNIVVFRLPSLGLAQAFAQALEPPAYACRTSAAAPADGDPSRDHCRVAAVRWGSSVRRA
jgi:threonine aldolase